MTDWTPTPLKHLSAASIGAMAPATILRYAPGDRVAIAEARHVIRDAAAERIDALERELETARRAFTLADKAASTADAIADSETDPQHGRQPGDVILTHANGHEVLVLGVRRQPRGWAVQYLTVPYVDRLANEGDGPRPEWVNADHFRRP